MASFAAAAARRTTTAKLFKIVERKKRKEEEEEEEEETIVSRRLAVLAVLCYAREQSRVESSRVESSVGLLLLPLIYDRLLPLKAAAAIQFRLSGEQRGNE